MQKVFKLEEIESVVKKFVENLGSATVVGFSGNLGAGKTTFTKELLKQLGFEGNVISPTFVLRRDYDLYLPQPLLAKEGSSSSLQGEARRGRLIHIDAYRLEKPEHVYQVISKEELANKNNLVIVEWPELSENIFDAVYLFEHVDEDTRKISKK